MTSASCALRGGRKLVNTFFSCPFARDCWTKIKLTWDLSPGLDACILQGKRNSGHDFFIEAALIATWEIWKMRNDKIFDRHNPSIDR
jgi:hypothetical protein